MSKSRTLMNRWSGQHAWVTRAAEWDREEDRILRAEVTDSHRKAIRRDLAIAQASMNVISHRLVLLAQDPEKLRTQDLPRLMDSASKLQQTVYASLGGRGLTAAGTTDPLDDFDLEELSDEEIRAHLEGLRREIDADLALYPDPDLEPAPYDDPELEADE